MTKLTAFEEKTAKLLKHLLIDDTVDPDSLSGDTVADEVCDYIATFEDIGLEKEFIEFVEANPNVTLEQLGEFYDSHINLAVETE